VLKKHEEGFPLVDVGERKMASAFMMSVWGGHPYYGRNSRCASKQPSRRPRILERDGFAYSQLFEAATTPFVTYVAVEAALLYTFAHNVLYPLQRLAYEHSPVVKDVFGKNAGCDASS
jgi:hypothetical protein